MGTDRQTWPCLTRYTGEHLNKVAFPLGGIGTGTVSLGGRAELRDVEIMNTPARLRLPLGGEPWLHAAADGKMGVVMQRMAAGRQEVRWGVLEGALGSVERIRLALPDGAAPQGVTVEVAGRAVPCRRHGHRLTEGSASCLQNP